jgi:hypothetical protein
MGLFVREKNDGRRAPGYGLYLLGGLSVIGMVMVLHQRASSGQWGSPQPRHARASDVASITEAAAAVTAVKVNSKASPSKFVSYDDRDDDEGQSAARQGTDGAQPAPFNAIAAALVPASDGGGGSTEKSAYARLPPSFAEENAGREAQGSGALLLAYRDRSADPVPATDSVPLPEAAAGAGTYLVPKGTLIPAYLLTQVDTANPSAILEFAAARALVFNHRYQLPFGTRFLGALSGPAMRDRLVVSVDTILYPDGLELPIKGTCVEAGESGSDIRPGVGASYYPPPAWVQVAPYFSDLVTGYLGLLQSRALPQVTIGTGGGFSVQSAGSAAPQAQLYQASAQAIQGFTEARLKEIEQRYAAHYVVPAGTSCWLQLTEDLDLGPAHSGTKASDAPPR